MTKPHTYCQEKTYNSGSSFYYSFLFLPKAQRQAMTVIYAFCREVDDITDNSNNTEIAELKLKWWQQEIENAYHGTPSHPVGKAIQEILAQFKLQKHIFLEILHGMLMDLKYQGYQTFADLKLYCHCVASTVGMLAAEIFGYKHQQTLEYARNLGIALQLINIIRDIGEDAMRQRIYLPQDELDAYNISPTEILNHQLKHPDAFIRLMQSQADRALHFYNQAMAILPQEDRATQKPGLIMANIYLALLRKITKSRFNVLQQRITIAPIKKFFIALKVNNFA